MGVKQFAHKAIRATGFDVIRAAPKEDPPKPFIPSVRDFSICGVDFQMWIADSTAAAWYDPSLAHNVFVEHSEMSRHIKPGFKVLDIGAHHGFETLFFSKLVGPSGFVLSVEASPYNSMIASSQVTLNDCKNVKVMNTAVSDKAGSINLTFNTNGVITSSVESISVCAITVDELDAAFGPFDAIKIDVEGYEGFVLDGAKEMMKRLPPIFMELHTPYLAQFGYDGKAVLNRLDPSYQGTFVSRTERQTLKPYNADHLPFDIVNLALSAAIEERARGKA